MSIQITDQTSALFVFALFTIAFCWICLMGYVLISVGKTVLAYRRGEDWRQVWRDQMAEW